MAELREVTTAEAEALFAVPGTVMIDVREAWEVAEGAVAGSIPIPLGALTAVVGSVVPDKATPILTICAHGYRSLTAEAELMELGYTDVASVSGGFELWNLEGRQGQAPTARYARHISLAEIGESGQQKLLRSRVLILGAGGLGSAAAMYLAAAGVGTLGVVDSDVVEGSNLQRQILHNDQSIGEPKVDSAKKTITALNADVNVIALEARLDASNAAEMIDGYDVVVDGSDNFETRYALNVAALAKRIPVIYGSVFAFEGRATVFDPHNGPCYRCMTPTAPPAELAPNCSEVGVLGALTGVIGSIQATEAIKMVLGIGEPLVGRLLTYDALEQHFRTYTLERDPACVDCGEAAFR